MLRNKPDAKFTLASDKAAANGLFSMHVLDTELLFQRRRRNSHIPNSVQMRYNDVKRQTIDFDDSLDESYGAFGLTFIQFPSHNFISVSFYKWKKKTFSFYSVIYDLK